MRDQVLWRKVGRIADLLAKRLDIDTTRAKTQTAASSYRAMSTFSTTCCESWKANSRTLFPLITPAEFILHCDELGVFIFGRSARDLSLWQARPRGVAEFTISVAEFTKSSLAGQKLLQVSKILLIFVARLLHTNDINTI